MASKLRVAELRVELENRGLDTSGLKAALVARLEEAWENEGGGQRKDDDHRPSKRAKVDLQALTVAELRSALTDRGLSSVGRKAELAERLSAALNGSATVAGDDLDASASAEGTSQAEGSSKEKIVTATKKGRAVLDKELPPQLRSYHVLEIGDDVYDAMLNQSNVQHNNNKFYVIQVLESDDKSSYYTYIRYGRVGSAGKSEPKPFSNARDAINLFEKKFYDKTRNHWSNRQVFVSHPGKYTLIEMDYEEDEPKTEVQNKKEVHKEKGPPKQTKLDNRVGSFISLICNTSMMRQQMVEIGYNAEKMPLGKLSKRTILKGYEVLKRIQNVIESGGRHQQLAELTSEFYTVIPHDFGRKDIRSQVISTLEHLKKKIEMVESLAEIEVATKLLVDADNEDDPAYAHYKRLKCALDPVDVKSEEYAWISKYLKNTHGQTHSNYDLRLEQVFKVEREGENDRFGNFANTPNRMLLWHGSRLTNWTGILSQGLRIAPPEAPSTGYMFGKGVYFADMVSKSANYCNASHSEPRAVLLLCEVALGDMNELREADFHASASNLPAGKLSTKGVGVTGPDPQEYLALPDGVVVPLGKPTQQQSKSHSSLLYNEYIVYKTEQIRMRYIMQVRFNYKRR